MKDEKIRYAMLQDENMLKSQNVESTRQINTLKPDRLNLMKQLRHTADQMRETGIRFMGLRAYQIITVTGFASVLRDGSIELPLNDRSMELMADLSTSKAEREYEKLTVERLEREIIGLDGKYVGNSNNSSDMAVTRQVLEDTHNRGSTTEEGRRPGLEARPPSGPEGTGPAVEAGRGGGGLRNGGGRT